jgi:hypothetical protein
MIDVQTIRLFHQEGFEMDTGESAGVSRNAAGLHGPDNRHHPSS